MSSVWHPEQGDWELCDEEFIDGEQWNQQSDGEQWDEQGMDVEQEDEESMDWCEEPADDEEDEQLLDPEYAGVLLDEEMSMEERWIGELSDEEEWDNEPIEGEQMIIEYMSHSCPCDKCVAHGSSEL